MNRLQGKTAVITGAGSGIGGAVAQLFASEGANVYAIDLNREAVDAVVNSISKNKIRYADTNVAACECNVTNQAEVRNVFSGMQRIDIQIKTNNGTALLPKDQRFQYTPCKS